MGQEKETKLETAIKKIKSAVCDEIHEINLVKTDEGTQYTSVTWKNTSRLESRIAREILDYEKEINRARSKNTNDA